MNTFHLYLSLGIHHILDLNAYDHILFIITLCGVYSLVQWRKVIILVTAFTIGHSITLALATLKILMVPTDWIEFLIPLTIFITALANTLQKSGKISKKRHLFKYFTAMFFGLIHGLGFSTYLRSLLGRESNIVGPLFSFNLGIEIGQFTILIIIMALAFLFIDLLGAKRRDWNLILSGAGLGVSLIMMAERFPGF